MSIVLSSSLYINLFTEGTVHSTLRLRKMKYSKLWFLRGVLENSFYVHKEKKEEIWLCPMTKAPTPTEMSKGQNDYTNNATKKFDYTAAADRLRTVSWSNYSHPTGVVNLVYGPNLPTPRNSRVIKRTHVKKNCKLTSLYGQKTNSLKESKTC